MILYYIVPCLRTWKGLEKYLKVHESTWKYHNCYQVRKERKKERKKKTKGKRKRSIPNLLFFLSFFSLSFFFLFIFLLHFSFFVVSSI